MQSEHTICMSYCVRGVKKTIECLRKLLGFSLKALSADAILHVFPAEENGDIFASGGSMRRFQAGISAPKIKILHPL